MRLFDLRNIDLKEDFQIWIVIGRMEKYNWSHVLVYLLISILYRLEQRSGNDSFCIIT